MTATSPGLLRRVEANGLHCWADSLRLEGYRGLALLSMFGARNAVRAAWASLFKAKSWTGIQVGGEHLTRSDGVSYVSVHSPMDRNTLHTIVIHPHATRQGGSYRTSFLQVGPNAETRFFVRLTRECPVPMRVQWREEIWRMGIEKQLIVLLNGFGLPLYEVKTDGDTWAEIVRDALVEGRIC